MSNPAVAPREPFTGPAHPTPPDATWYPSLEFERYKAVSKRIDEQQRRLAPLDMEVCPAIVVPRSLTVDEAVLTANGETLAMAKKGKPTFRKRTAQARSITCAIWAELPQEGPFYARKEVGERMLDRFFVDAGTEFTLGRLAQYYPRHGQKPTHPVSREEASRAVANCGLRLSDLPEHELAPYPLIAVPGKFAVTVNPKSDNGFPVLGKFEDKRAQELVYGLAVTVRSELRKAAHTLNGVEEWKTRAELERPWLVALRGKAKGDYYNAEKIKDAKLRFYNALPRQIMLNMQVATQPMERLAKTILEVGHSGIGVSLVRGGAHALVDALDWQLAETGRAYVHVGDDSWVAVRSGGSIVMFALDCSSFDLTQHADTTLEVHKAVWRELQRIDGAAADLWYAYMRSRLVVTVGTLVRRWKHGGPSGMPLQSKVNDLLMDVLIQRVLRSGARWGNRESVDAAIQAVGEGMGFKVRVEQYGCLPALSMFEYLQRKPFLFIGHYFHLRGKMIVPFTDLPRTMSQIPYPNLKWLITGKEVAVMEAMRLGSIFLSAGVPPAAMEGAYAVWQLEVVRLLEYAIREFGDQESEKLRWAVSASPWGPEVIPSLTGLLRAVQRGWEELWAMPASPAVPTKELIFTTELPTSWADVVEMEEEELQRSRPVETTARPVAAPSRPAPTHPATARNDGRPPPTAVWGPPKPPREVDYGGPSQPRRGRGRRFGRVLEQEEEEWEEEFDDWEPDNEPYSE